MGSDSGSAQANNILLPGVDWSAHRCILNSTPSQQPKDRGRSGSPLELALPAEGTAAQPPANRRDKRRPLALPMLSNRRTHERVPIQALVICIVGSRTMRGVSRNLSEGGMQVEVSGLKPKERVQLSFRSPTSGLAVDAVGAVIWGDDRRHGIHFAYVGAQSRQSIHRYIAERN